MENQIQKHNQQLTDKQQTLLDKIVKAGNVTEIEFAKKTIDFVKIRDLSDDIFSLGLMLVIVKISNLIGIKNAISDINKQDISKLIDTRFKNLSLEEINYAFELERFGKLEPRTQHFQLFNAEYVSEVLGKYKKWITKIRFDNNLKLSRQKEKNKITQEEKDMIVWQGVIDCFEHFNSTQEIEDGRVWIYEHLDELGLLNYTAKEKINKMKLAKEDLLKTANLQVSYLKRTDLINKITKQKDSELIKNHAKKMLLKDYFARLIAKSDHIKNHI